MTQISCEGTHNASSLELALLFSQSLHEARAEHARACAELAAAFLASHHRVRQLAKYDGVVRHLDSSSASLKNAEGLLPSIHETLADHPHFDRVSEEALRLVDSKLFWGNVGGVDLTGWGNFREALRTGGFRQVFSEIRDDCAVLAGISNDLSVILKDHMSQGRAFSLYALLSDNPDNEFWRKQTCLQRFWIDTQERALWLQFSMRELRDIKPDLPGEATDGGIIKNAGCLGPPEPPQ